MQGETRKAKTFRLTETCAFELEALASDEGVSQTDAIHDAIHSAYEAIHGQYAHQEASQDDSERIKDLKDQISFLHEQIAIKDEQIANWSKSLQANQIVQAAQTLPALETAEAKEGRSRWERFKDFLRG